MRCKALGNVSLLTWKLEHNAEYVDGGRPAFGVVDLVYIGISRSNSDRVRALSLFVLLRLCSFGTASRAWHAAIVSVERTSNER